MRYSKLNIWGVLLDVLILLNARFSANLTNSKNFGDSIRVPKRTMSRWVESIARPTLCLVSAETIVCGPYIPDSVVPRCR